MTNENLSLILILVGSFISISLTVNAFFIKQLISSLSKVELGLAVLINDHENSDSKIVINREEIDKSNIEIKSLRDKMHLASNEINKIKLRQELNGEISAT